MIGEMAILDRTGDTKVIWDSGREAEVEVARSTFDRLKKDGYAAFKVNTDGSQGELIKKFDPAAGKLIMVPQMVGG